MLPLRFLSSSFWLEYEKYLKETKNPLFWNNENIQDLEESYLKNIYAFCLNKKNKRVAHIIFPFLINRELEKRKNNGS